MLYYADKIQIERDRMPRTVGSMRRARTRNADVRQKAEAGKRYPLNMRTTKEIRDRLERSAQSSGRSLAQEVEFRLGQTFEAEDLAGGRELALLFRMMSALGGLVEAKTGHRWQEHYETFVAVERGWDRIWEQFKMQVRPATMSPEAVAALHQVASPLPKMPDLPRPTRWELQGDTYATRSGLAGLISPARFISLDQAQNAATQWEKYEDDLGRIRSQYEKAEPALKQEALAYIERYQELGEVAAQQVRPDSGTARKAQPASRRPRGRS